MKNFRNIFLMMAMTGGILMVVVGCTQANMQPNISASPMKIVESSEGFTVMDGKERVLFYQRRPKSLHGEYSRCHYIHPLYGLDGEILTEDFPDDHPHQRGIFWAWHQILVGDKSVSDGWILKDFFQDVYNVETSMDSESATLKVHLYWKSPAWTDDKGRQKPFVEETTIIRVYRALENMRKIDFQISLLALEDGVRIGGSDNEKGYGGFSPRVRTPKGLVFTGQKGLVQPRNLAVEAGPWLDFSGDFRGDGNVSGLAVLCHKSIPGYPTPWILRQKESMQNAVYPGRYPVPLSRQKPLVLRYRLIVHRGNAQQVNLDELQAQYDAEGHFNAEPLAKVIVEAGGRNRVDTPVSVLLGDISDCLSDAEFRLEEIRGSERLPVPAQLEPGDKPRLWWILSGTTPAGDKRVYELLKGQSVKAPPVKVMKNDSFLQIQVGGSKVLRYNHALVPPPKEASPLYTRSGFIHPVWSPTEEILTDMHPPDHIHHLGVWMPWTKTTFEGQEVDFWNLKKGQGTVRFVKFISTASGAVYGGFRSQHEHVVLKAAEGEKVVLEETWDVRVYNLGGPEKSYWLWDLVSAQRCVADSPLHLPEYRYGGLGFRGARQWLGENASYLTSEGRTRKDGHGTRGRWCDMAGLTGKDWAGVTIMSHPENFRHPEPIRIWPNPREGVFFCFAPSQLGDWKIEPAEDYLWRYRFYVHEGKIRVADAERIWYDFAEPPKVKLEKILK